MSAAIPCPFGGSSQTSQPRYDARIGSTQSARWAARSSAVR